MSLFDKVPRRKTKSTRKLAGAKTFSEYGIELYDKSELVFFRVAPSNLSVLSPTNIETKVRYLTMVLSTMPELEFCCLDSFERFDRNKQYLKEQTAKEPNVCVRELLSHDYDFLDEIQIETATAREFLFAARFRNMTSQQVFNGVNRAEKAIRDQNFDVRRADKEDIKRILAIYFEGNITSGSMPDADGGAMI